MKLRKYLFVFSLYWQEGLQKRSSFFVERFRSIVVLLSFYYFWTALLQHRSGFAGYDRAQILTYVLGMNVLRSLVFASQTWEMSWEINRGQLAGYLLKPVNYMAYMFFRDLSEKSINFLSAIIEVFILGYLFKAGIQWPQNPYTWLLFFGAMAGAAGLYFLLSFTFGCWGFWTAESGGPRFLLELFLEFSAGAFFPLDVLPASIQAVLKFFPSPYLVFFPLHIFLEKLSTTELIQGFLMQGVWLLIAFGIAQTIWNRGVSSYSAEGSG